MLRWLPNILTLSRILIIPLVIISFYIEDKVLSSRLTSSLFLIASITDFFDGYFARVWSIQSNLGKFLDPIADKLLVAAIILMLINFDKINVLPSIAIICREILVSGLREFLAELRVSVPVSKLAKLKTTVQMVAIYILLLGNAGSGLSFMNILGNIFIWVASILTLISGYAYMKAVFQYIVEHEGK